LGGVPLTGRLEASFERSLQRWNKGKVLERPIEITPTKPSESTEIEAA